MLLNGCVLLEPYRTAKLTEHSYVASASTETKPSRLTSRATKTRNWPPISSSTSPTTTTNPRRPSRIYTSVS